MKFELSHTDTQTKARVGQLFTAHGVIETPIFMPVGTVGTVKGVHVRELLHDIEAQIILGNSYHLYLRPTTDILYQAGGLHSFMNWQKPILTDSGGYQVYSLGHIRKIEEEGVIFNSHIDGSKHKFMPENVIQIQRKIGSDIMMAFDECTPYPSDFQYTKVSMERTHRWLKRCFEEHKNSEPLYGSYQSLFPIIQGGVYPELRKESANYCASFEADGNAIGGLSVGESHEIMYEITNIVTEILPKEKPRYLMGVGTPENILEAIALGVDMFDCVMPTRNARNGMIFTTKGIINIRNEKWKNDFSPIDEDLGGYVSSSFSKSYLRHLNRAGEMLGAQMASIQNLRFYLWLVKTARQKILLNDFLSWKNTIIPQIMQRL